MQTFVRAVELGSLSAVAREQGSTQPTISKTVAALEQELGVRLLQR
ncbi:LysR family transcriptional regulator, partial [Lysobacter sp. 2RAB21]